MRLSLLIGATVLLIATPALAQSVSFDNLPDTNDFLVVPANVELIVKPGESRSFDLRVTNRTGLDARFLVSAEDLDSSSYNDKQNSVRSAPVFPSLTAYLESRRTDFVLGHGETILLPITISVPAYVDEPGLYALVTVTTSSDTKNKGAAGAAKLLSRVGVPVLVRTSDTRKGSGKLLSFGTADAGWVFTGPTVPLKLSYENIGEVHIRPFGKITFRNLLGRVAGEVLVEPWYILPGTTRSRVVDLPTPGHFGYYTASLEMEDGYGSLTALAKTNVWIFPREIVLIISIALVCLVMVLCWLRRLANKSRKPE